MSATKLVVAVALLLSATSAALAQGPQCYGDRPYYDFYGAGWLDSEWRETENSRRAKFYTLTREGKKQLGVETADWTRRASAIARLLKAEV